MRGQTIEEALRGASFRLKQAGLTNPRDEAEYLLSWASGKERLALYVNRDAPLSPLEVAIFEHIVQRRCLGEPLAYITGVKEFYGLEFIVNRHVLIPRPETEGIVEAALRWTRQYDESGREAIEAVDLGAGSGNLAVTLASLLKNVHFKAVDQSAEALAVAYRNACRHGIADRISWYRGDYFGAFSHLQERPRFNLIVANPPYIKRSDLAALPPSVIHFEPYRALDGGEDGLDGFRSLLRDLPAFVAPSCFVALEIGAGQVEAVTALCRALKLFRSIKVRPDYQGIPRIVEGLI